MDVWMRVFVVGDGSGCLVLVLEIVICLFGAEMEPWFLEACPMESISEGAIFDIRTVHNHSANMDLCWSEFHFDRSWVVVRFVICKVRD